MNLYLLKKLELSLFKERLRKMKSVSYEVLGKEAGRLLRQQKSLLNKSLKTPDLFDKNRDDKQESYNFKEVEESIKEIDNELHKLETMETIIAVVGTMKAGKSTTINAIVGKEILPNRNDPMTTLPTLIRNKHKQVEPLLTLAKTSTLINLSKKVAKKLSLIKVTGLAMNGTDDGKELISMLMKNKGYDFKSSYLGQKEIFHFLRHLNDIMRLAKELEISVDDVYEGYQESKDLPLIEVEFCHLQAMEQSASGNLSILDTPGPNEIGQSEALKTVFLKQLKRATSIMLVIDYTQMRSEADASVREEIKKISNELDKDRLSILVNKFDQTNEHSMDKEDVQDYVASSLMKDSSLKSRVFPVSSAKAYLANRALNYLSVNNEIPEVKENENSWISDFGRKAFGDMWLLSINNTELVKKAAGITWDNSFFQEPLNNVIKDSHANAAKLCVTASVAKLSGIHERFGNTINIRSTALNKEIKQIQRAIETIEENIKDISKLSDDIKQTANQGIKSFSSKLELTIEGSNTALQKEVDSVFEEGNNLATKGSEAVGKRLAAAVKSDIRSELASIFSLGNTDHVKKKQDNIRKKYKYEPKDDIVSFENENEAKSYLRKVNTRLNSLITEARNVLEKQFTENIVHLSEAIDSQISQKAQEVLHSAKNKLKDDGFNLTLTPPQITASSHEIRLEIILNKGYQEEVTSETKNRRSDSMWGGLCKMFSTDDWGWES